MTNPIMYTEDDIRGWLADRFGREAESRWRKEQGRDDLEALVKEVIDEEVANDFRIKVGVAMSFGHLDDAYNLSYGAFMKLVLERAEAWKENWEARDG